MYATEQQFLSQAGIKSYFPSGQAPTPLLSDPTLRPLASPPPGLVAIGTSFLTLKKGFFFSSWYTHLAGAWGPATKKRIFLFCGIYLNKPNVLINKQLKRSLKGQVVAGAQVF